MTKPHLVESLGQGPKRRMNYLILLLLKLEFCVLSLFVYFAVFWLVQVFLPVSVFLLVLVFRLVWVFCLVPVYRRIPVFRRDFGTLISHAEFCVCLLANCGYSNNVKHKSVVF